MPFVNKPYHKNNSSSSSSSNIYDGASSAKRVNNLAVNYFCKRSSVLYVWLGFNYVSDSIHPSWLFLHENYKNLSILLNVQFIHYRRYNLLKSKSTLHFQKILGLLPPYSTHCSLIFFSISLHVLIVSNSFLFLTQQVHWINFQRGGEQSEEKRAHLNKIYQLEYYHGWDEELFCTFRSSKKVFFWYFLQHSLQGCVCHSFASFFKV